MHEFITNGVNFSTLFSSFGNIIRKERQTLPQELITGGSGMHAGVCDHCGVMAYRVSHNILKYNQLK